MQIWNKESQLGRDKIEVGGNNYDIMNNRREEFGIAQSYF